MSEMANTHEPQPGSLLNRHHPTTLLSLNVRTGLGLEKLHQMSQYLKLKDKSIACLQEYRNEGIGVVI